MTKRLWTTKELAAAICEREKINSDYGLAKMLGVNQNTAAGWRRGFRVMSDDLAEQVAPYVDEDPAWLLLCLAIERVTSAKLADDMRALLLAAVNRAALVALGLGVVFGSYAGHFGIT